MTRTLIGLEALLWLVAAGLAQGQSAPTGQPPLPPPPREAKEPDPKLRHTYEDVEVFRRLLNRGFASAYGLPAQGPVKIKGTANEVVDAATAFRFWAQGDVHKDSHHLAASEGVYLKGVGVVYGASLPVPLTSPVGKEPGENKRLSDWERARLELRGETVKAEANEPAIRQAPLADRVLKVLAENGHHFKQLADAEQITVAVTFRPGGSCVSCHEAGKIHLSGVPGTNLNRYVLTPPQEARLAEWLGKPQPALPADVLNEVRLGDLHLKQGKAREASQAYKKALLALSLALREGGVKEDNKVPIPFLLIAAEIQGKLANAHLANKDAAAAQQALQGAAKLLKTAEERAAGTTGQGPRPSGVQLPAKLIVSAPKKLLDQVGKGQITFAEFRKAATVEYQTFPPPAKK
jgi:hypothetical protein